MGLFKDWQGSRYIMHLFVINLVCCLGWLSGTAFGQLQLSETVSGAVSLPAVGITCLGNLAVFFSSFMRGRLFLEMGAKDALTILTGRIKLKRIKGLKDKNYFGLTTSEIKGQKQPLSDCSVIMLSKESPKSSMRQFMEYIANVYDVRSVLLQYLPIESLSLTLQICTCPLRVSDRSYDSSRCGCIVFWRGVDEVITIMLAQQIPETLKRLPHALCLLPSFDCLKNGCHGCNDGLLHVETDVFQVEDNETNEIGKTKRLIEREFRVEGPVEDPAAVCGAHYSPILGKPATCICIPVPKEGYGRVTDSWTELLIGSFKSKDYETRGAIVRRELNSVSHDLENYMARSGQCYAEEEYSNVSLIMPRLAEILINLVLTFWFKVDGFSSALVARRAIKDYIVDNRVRGFAAHVFISKAEVRSDAKNTNVYQVLSFRGNLLNPKALSLIVGSVNLICSIIWVVLVSLEGGPNKWYHTHSMPPSKGRIAVIFASIAFALGMDCFDLYKGRLYKGWLHGKALVVCAMIVFEILCIVSGSIVARVLGVKAFGRWVYGAVQVFVWVKWGIGSYLLGHYVPRENSLPAWTYGSIGMYMYSSAFFLNGVLAGVRAKWDFS